MREISKLAALAFWADKTFNRDNTRVDRIEQDGKITAVEMYLHGNLIARKTDESVMVTLAGWGTQVTRERLNALADLGPNAVKPWHFSQHKHAQVIRFTDLDGMRHDIETHSDNEFVFSLQSGRLLHHKEMN